MAKILSICSREAFPAVYKLMQESFHPAEIRTYEKALKVLDHEDFNLLVTGEKNGMIDGMLAYWNFNKFYFLEYLAIQPQKRGSGLGSAMINEFLAECEKPAILEVEDLDTDIAKRRIGLYERLGFVLTDLRYIQPIMQEGETERIPLRIMSYKTKLDNETLAGFKKTLSEKLRPTV